MNRLGNRDLCQFRPMYRQSEGRVSIAVPIDMSEVKGGDNTIEFSWGGGGTTVVSNINIILIAASPVP